MNFKKRLAKNYINFRGWNTKRKLVLFESDDWGAVRMPSREAYDELLAKGVPVDTNYFTKYDCLESNQDLEQLFQVLSFFKDKNGNHPVITANALIANPDFEKVAASKFVEYHYESISETYNRYESNSKTLQNWKDNGIAKRMLWPQFHGREHLNPMEWLKVLNANVGQEKIGFEKRAILGIGNNLYSKRSNEYMAAFEFDDENEMNQIHDITKKGLVLFEELFGFKSKSFVASCSIRSEKLDKVLSENGVLYHQLGQYLEPIGQGKYKLVNRFWGDTNQFGQIYWRRNATFEPSRNPTYDWVESCMAEIKIAFRWGKPAVINSHRVNYIGSIFEENRENGLRLLHNLIHAILKEWPETEFISSDQLGDFMIETIKK
jgi:hypothetical protein